MPSSLITLVALSLGAAAVPSPAQRLVVVTECDRLAAHGQDPERAAPGVDAATLAAQAGQAVAACQQAVSQYPDTGRLRFQLGRALWVAGKRDESLAEMRRAVEAGSSAAAGWLGARHTDGTLGKADFSEAARLFRIAAEKGDVAGQVLLAQAYREGQGVPMDPAEELKWLRRAAEQGNADALSHLALKYLDGAGVEKDPAEAAKLLQRAAEKADAWAQRTLGNLYLSGIGVPRNVQTAIQWLEKAAWGGDESAQATLGRLYFEGKEVARDDPRATQWLLKLASRTTPAGTLARDNLCTMLGDQRVSGGDVDAAAKICKGWTRPASLLAQAKPGGIATAAAKPEQAPPPQPAPQLRPEDLAPVAVPRPPPPGPPLPAVKFNFKDPCEAGQWKQPGALWLPASGPAPPRAPSSALPVVKTPALDIKSLSEAQYAGVVSMAKESMRVLYGPLEKDDAARFEAIWAPLFDHPSAEVVDYLNRLNPLLGQFLAGRSSMGSAILDYQQAMADAALSRTAGDDGMLLEALADVDRARAAIQSLEAGMAEVAAKIQALGNPPNALESKCKAAARHARAVAAETGSPFDTVSVHGAFIGGREKSEDVKLLGVDVSVRGSKGGRVSADDASVVADESYEGVCRGAEKPDPDHTCSDKRRILISFGADGKTLKEVRAWRISTSKRKGREDNEPAWDNLTIMDLPLIRNETRTSWGVRIYGVRGADALKHLRLHEGNVALTRRATPEDDLWVALSYGDPGDDLPEEIAGLMKRGGLLNRITLDVMPPAWALGLGSRPPDTPPARSATPPPEALPNPPAAASPAGQNDRAEEEALKETIAFHQANIAIIQGNLRGIQDDIDEEKKRQPADAREATDKEKRLADLEILARKARDDTKFENDLIASYQTGTLVHTRSEFDEYAHANFVLSLQQGAERFDATAKIQRSIEKMILMVPANQQEALRAKAKELITPQMLAAGDVEKAREVAEAVGTNVQNYWQQQSAQNRAIVEAQNQTMKEMAKMVAGTVLISAAPGALAWKFGGEAAAYWWAPSAAGAAFGGVTGYVHGGVTGAVQEGLAWAHLGTAMISEFWKGYTEKDEKGVPKGLAGGGTRVLVMGAVAVGVAAFGGLVSAARGPAKATWAEVVDMARYNQEMSDAQSLVAKYRQKGWDLIKARASNVPAAEIAKLEKETSYLAASLNSSYHCKLVLKHHGDPITQGLFVEQVDAIHNTVHPAFIKRMEAMGYRMENLRFSPIRNASSGRTPNMDFDLMAEEYAGMTILKKNAQGGYRRVDKSQMAADAQRAYEEAYHEATGFSGRRSNIEVTWSGHSEAFADLELLSRTPDWSQVRNMPQAGVVTLGKANKFIAAEPMSMIAR
ncbi:MAG: tetratricopeptide repeat protein [Bryobacterales bacterium]|nr:tetratricopeptide repeat protein [Bryobacterales bacterium]